LFQIAPNFGRFLPSQILSGRRPPKWVNTPSTAAHQVAKFRGAISLSSKVMVAHTLHFKPILTLLLQKIVGGTPIPCGVWASKIGHSVARVKISERSTP